MPERNFIIKKLLKLLACTLGALFLLVILTAAAFQLSVKPGVFIISRMFDQPVVILDEPAYAAASANVAKIEDLSYPSEYGNSLMDIYYPASADTARGLLVWVHGGGFVAGDKEAIGEFATYISAGTGLAVAAINYEKAPALPYPGQVFQLRDAIRFLKDHHQELLPVNFSNLLLGGDSAGGQIAGQFAAVHTNPAYAGEMQMQPVVPSKNIKAFIAYSAPVNLQQLTEVQSDSYFMKFFVNTVARAFIGTKNWKNSPKTAQASIALHVNAGFPPLFITDGNVFSFQEQGMALADTLEKLQVPVSTLFYADSDKEIGHEYQFNYTTEEARDCLQKTIAFINEEAFRAEL